MKSKMSKLTFLRLCLSGAIAGAALFGVFAPIFGVDSSTTKEVASGIAGAGAVVAVKFAHLI
jgi:phosphate/sulfate permease